MPAPGCLHLVPVGLGPVSPDRWLPEATRDCAAGLTVFIAENAKTARAFLKQIQTRHAVQDIIIHTLDARTPDADVRQWLRTLDGGTDIGLVSEAGCPAVADPGARVVAMAHALGHRVVPHVGPSSILLALMASGLDGQRFAFHGYAPKEAERRARQLKDWQGVSRKQNQTQILIETPYRNPALFDALLQTLHERTRLCVARGLTTPDEWIRTFSVAQWKTQPAPELARIPAIFLFLAAP